jgi:hypothetical protein
MKKDKSDTIKSLKVPDFIFMTNPLMHCILLKYSQVFLGTEFMYQGIIKWGFVICMANTVKNKFIPATVAYHASLRIFKNRETSVKSLRQNI